MPVPGLVPSHYRVERGERAILETTLRWNQHAIDLTAPLHSDFSSHSLETVEGIMALEEEFHVEISDDETASIPTLAHLLTLIQTKMQMGRSSESPKLMFGDLKPLIYDRHREYVSL